jgi:hypothetical protein
MIQGILISVLFSTIISIIWVNILDKSKKMTEEIKPEPKVIDSMAIRYRQN